MIEKIIRTGTTRPQIKTHNCCGSRSGGCNFQTLEDERMRVRYHIHKGIGTGRRHTLGYSEIPNRYHDTNQTAEKIPKRSKSVS